MDSECILINENKYFLPENAFDLFGVHNIMRQLPTICRMLSRDRFKLGKVQKKTFTEQVMKKMTCFC